MNNGNKKLNYQFQYNAQIEHNRFVIYTNGVIRANTEVLSNCERCLWFNKSFINYGEKGLV